MADKTASGIIVYLQEELGDARLRAEQLSQLLSAATELVEKSSHKDHFYEVAGHLLYGIPDTAFKLQKALDAAALAAAKLDYEEIKQGLKPEKVEELEAALEDSRLRYLNRRSTEETMNPKLASDILNDMADEAEITGVVPVAKLARLIAHLERGVKRASDQPARAAATFRAAADHLLTAKNPSRTRLAQGLRRILADSQMDPTAGAGEEFQKENPKITDEQVEEINKQHDKNKDVVKDKAKEASGVEAAVDEDAAKELADDEKAKIEAGEYEGMKLAAEREARFEQGKPADPTENMSPEDAESWKAMNDKYKDVVKDKHKLCPRRSSPAQPTVGVERHSPSPSRSSPRGSPVGRGCHSTLTSPAPRRSTSRKKTSGSSTRPSRDRSTARTVLTIVTSRRTIPRGTGGSIPTSSSSTPLLVGAHRATSRSRSTLTGMTARTSTWRG